MTAHTKFLAMLAAAALNLRIVRRVNRIGPGSGKLHAIHRDVAKKRKPMRRKPVMAKRTTQFPEYERWLARRKARSQPCP